MIATFFFVSLALANECPDAVPLDPGESRDCVSVSVPADILAGYEEDVIALERLRADNAVLEALVKENIEARQRAEDQARLQAERAARNTGVGVAIGAGATVAVVGVVGAAMYGIARGLQLGDGQ